MHIVVLETPVFAIATTALFRPTTKKYQLKSGNRSFMVRQAHHERLNLILSRLKLVANLVLYLKLLKTL